MLSSVDVTDFRCFDRAQLRGLTRVNILTGANASGKSALLEALYLGTNATAVAVLNLVSQRNMNRQPMVLAAGLPIPLPIGGNQPMTVDAYFDPFFRTVRKGDGLKTARKISVKYKDTDNTRYAVEIGYQENDRDAPVVRGASGVTAAVPIVIQRQKTEDKKQDQNSTMLITLNQFGQLQQSAGIPLGPTTFIFGAGTDYAESDNVTWFSLLREQDQATKIIDFLRKEFPFIRDIEVLAPNGINGLYATLDDGTRRRVSAVSSGIYKIVSILLSTISIQQGIIILDEIENGVYYEKYPAVWRVLYEFAKSTQNQLFITSHSAECLGSLVDVIAEAPEDFCLVRTEREENRCVVRQFSGKAMKAALERQGEIRGATLGAHVDQT